MTEPALRCRTTWTTHYGRRVQCQYIRGHPKPCRPFGPLETVSPGTIEKDPDMMQNPGASSDEEAAQTAATARGGTLYRWERMHGNRLSVTLTDGRHIIVRRPDIDDTPESAMTNPTTPEAGTPAAAPFVGPTVAEPEVGTVLVYQRRLTSNGGERTYHYASIRAGDGRWYTTGGNARQGVDWHSLREVLADVGTVYAAASWVPLFGSDR